MNYKIGKTLSDLAELSDIKNVEGKEFVKFVIKGTEEVFEEGTVIDGDIELTAIYTDKPITPAKPMDKSPETGENNIFDIIVLAIAFTSLIGMAVVNKIKE